MAESLARVAIAAPLRTLFDYKAAAEMCVVPGMRVRVPFGRTSKIAVVVELPERSDVPQQRLKAIGEVLDQEPLLTSDDLAFLRWVAAYYHHPVGEVIVNALPLRLRKMENARLPGECGWMLTESGRAQALQALARAPRQAAILSWLHQRPDGSAAQAVLRDALPDSRAVLHKLVGKGWLEEIDMPVVADRVPADARHLELNPEQGAALQTLRQRIGQFAVALLDGVTGSGKTEVYLQLAAEVLARGGGVMVLVPEIALTPQLAQRFHQRLGDTVRVMHSGLTDVEREQSWHRLRLGLSRVLLGTRSSVFAPMPDLGLVLVDEEHDPSYKQTEGFRYSARDLAVARARRGGCPVVLGSATPSLESLRNAQLGRYEHLRLTQRAGGASGPRVDLVDIRDQPLQCGLSQPLLERVDNALARDEQVILFLNRRGFAPVLTCYDCGWLSDCPRCDARQTLHRSSDLLWCHHCGAQRRVPKVCPDCGGSQLHPLGRGTEQLEEFLAERFVDTPLIRVDRDTTARRGALERQLQRLQSADGALLVGTQMLAKGHHFPRVTLVGVVDADGGLFSADFRAAERMAQLLVQVAGRAGRGERPGQVLIQTRYPDHPLLLTLARRGYAAFAREALDERAAATMPPFSHQALLRAEATQLAPARAFVEALASGLREVLGGDVELWGPVPAPMTRRAGKHRVHLLLQSITREPLHRALALLVEHAPAVPQANRVRWSLDVDPIDLY
jgi:primosomal protein N' (replication factor Y)